MMIHICNLWNKFISKQHQETNNTQEVCEATTSTTTLKLANLLIKMRPSSECAAYEKLFFGLFHRTKLIFFCSPNVVVVAVFR